jgi:hypothetical protein
VADERINIRATFPVFISGVSQPSIHCEVIQFTSASEPSKHTAKQPAPLPVGESLRTYPFPRGPRE